LPLQVMTTAYRIHMATVSPFQAHGIRGFLHVPASQLRQALVLTHGAGGNCDAPVLVEAANAFCAVGLHVLRFDLPFRQRRPTGPPPRGSAVEDRGALRSAVAEMRDMVSAGRIVLGGHSYGGRQASMLAAAEPAVADMLLLFSYPLHPPKKPAQTRTEHFPDLRIPAVFVHGTNDGFGTVEELRAAVASIPAPTTVLPVDGAGHDLKRGRFDLTGAVAAVLG
jgi:predicted alpha/beta-hydrolase family hydrolase